jgi:hypothetical protein
MKGLNQFQKSSGIFLVLLPFIYLLAGIYFRNLLGDLSLRSIDPDYAYFISGLQIAEGFFKPGHIDHPGTPLQVFIALVFRLVYLFRDHTIPFTEDVFLNPDLYLSVVNTGITALTSVLILYSGKKVFQYTNSILYAVLVQTTPFLPIIWFDLIGRVVPELMFPFPIMLLTVLVLKIYSEKDSVSLKTVTGLAFLCALGLSVKITFLPVCLIPFLIVKGWKQKLIIVGVAVLLFFIISFPVTLQSHIFWGWVKNLFLHSGKYGGGDANIIDFTTFMTSLRELMGYEKQFFYTLYALIALFFIYLLWLRKKAEKKIVLLALSVFLALGLQLFLVGKHYAHHYFIPALMLAPLLVFLIAELVKKMIPVKLAAFIIPLFIFACLVWGININRFWLPVKSEAIGTAVKNRMFTWHQAQLLEKNSYKVIVSQDYGCPFVEYSLIFSTVWANHKKREEYYSILNKLYPNTYNYFTWDNTLKYWGDSFDAKKIIDSGEKVYLYLERDSEELLNKTMAKLKDESLSPFTGSSRLFYHNTLTNEVIYELLITNTDEFRDATE